MEKSELFYYCTGKYCPLGMDKRPFQVEVDSSGKDILKCPSCEGDNVKVIDPQPVAGAGIKKNKLPYTKYGIIGGIIILVIVALIFFFTGNSNSDENQEELVFESTEVIEETDKTVPKSTSTTPEGTQTLKFKGGSKYVGEVEENKMHGLGTYYYGKKELISPKDLKKRYAQAGDYLIGEFYQGKVVSGKLYDKNNKLKEIIMIGR